MDFHPLTEIDMSTKQIFYLFLVIFVAGCAALTGAAGGAWLVYRWENAADLNEAAVLEPTATAAANRSGE